MLGWIIGAVIVLLLLVCVIFMVVHFYDCPACSMAEDEKYRNVLRHSTRRDFQATFGQLLEILDGIQESARQVAPPVAGAETAYEATNEFYKTAKDVYNKCLQLEKTSREIWSNPKYTKDFYFFVGLHYVSRYLGNILSGEQRNLKQFLRECVEAEHGVEQEIQRLRKAQQEAEEFEERREFRIKEEECNQAMRDLGSLRNRFGEITGIYAERVEKQNIETIRRAEFIATHFKKQGPEWKQTMSVRPRRQ